MARSSKDVDEMRQLLALDDIVARVADGQYVVPISDNAPRYLIQKLDRYCKKKGIDPSTLTDAELKRFEAPPPQQSR